LDNDPDVNEMIERAKSDSRNFSSLAVDACRDRLLSLGYGDNRWKGQKFSDAKCG